MSEYTAEDYERLYKIILVGDISVGKTFLLSRYTRGVLPKSSRPTLGVEFATHTVPLSVGGTVKAQIWDTAGHEKYRTITSAHFRNAKGALIVYDVTRKQTFQNASKWLSDIKAYCGTDLIIILVGNKVDLAEGNPFDRQVTTEFAEEYARKNKLLFFEASAVTAHNVKRVFETIIQEIHLKDSRVSEVQIGRRPGGNRSGLSPYLLDADIAGMRFTLDDDFSNRRPTNGCCQQL